MKLGQWGALLLLSVLMGSAYFFYQILVRGLPPLTIVLGRVGIAAALLTTLAVAGRHWVPLDARRWRDFLVVGALSNAIPFALTAWASQRIAGGFTSILNATTPGFTIVVMGLAGREAITWNHLVGLALGLVGVALLVGPSAFHGGDARSLPAIGAVLLSALCYALAGLWGLRFADLAPIQVAAAQVTAATVIILPFALAIEHPWTLAMPSLSVIGALLGIGLLATTATYILYYRILFAVGATDLLLVTLLMPVTALALGIALLGERLSGGAVAGAAIIALSLLAIDGRILNWPRGRSAGQEGRKHDVARKQA